MDNDTSNPFDVVAYLGRMGVRVQIDRENTQSPGRTTNQVAGHRANGPGPTP